MADAEDGDYPALRVALNEDEISTGNTEDSLLSSSSRTSTETISCSRMRSTQCCPEEKNSKFAKNCKIFSGIFLICWGVAMIVYKPYNMLMDLRIELTPGLPPYEWWLDPPDEVLLKVYLFNITNSEEFLAGTDKKIKVSEVGPITYREKLTHTNPTFNENGTFTYTANRTAIYLPEMNTIDLNATIVMPNLAVLLIPSYLWDAPLFSKFGVNLMMRSLRSKPFINTTIYNYLWNCTDPILDVSQAVAPSLVPTKNVGVLGRVYTDFVDNVTVYIGTKFGHEKFFLIDKYDGSEYMPDLEGKCEDKVANSSEGISYPQYLTKNDTLRYWRKTLCRVGTLRYSHEVEMYGVTAYRYELENTTYDRTTPSDGDCYKGEPKLPNGLSDVSKCNFDMPFAASFPHYLHGDRAVKNSVDGLRPDAEKHGSFVIVEPNTGIPLHGIARSQVNLVMREMRGFSEKIQRFSNVTIPLVWMEYNQVGIPWYIEWLIYFTVVLVPVLQYVGMAFFIGLGGFLVVYFGSRRSRRSNLLKNKALTFETQVFLKPS
ncbi:hypothetical protein NQ318_014983 [Aromia moschata]|uniref:Scavenger receptor class B member 1 n=1 Tax=Aromia moschata TaxID=1265417 RepID=A0AAV8YZM2_9CUCU|nr:hypothetical protein NQ318_014983 [Aromia moschata]